MTSLLLAIAGMYFIFYSLKVTVFRYDDESSIPKEDRFLYWGSIPILIIGVVLIVCGMMLS